MAGTVVQKSAARCKPELHGCKSAVVVGVILHTRTVYQHHLLGQVGSSLSILRMEYHSSVEAETKFQGEMIFGSITNVSCIPDTVPTSKF